MIGLQARGFDLDYGGSPAEGAGPWRRDFEGQMTIHDLLHELR
jgi:hypothetical protein